MFLSKGYPPMDYIQMIHTLANRSPRIILKVYGLIHNLCSDPTLYSLEVSSCSTCQRHSVTNLCTVLSPVQML